MNKYFNVKNICIMGSVILIVTFLFLILKNEKE